MNFKKLRKKVNRSYYENRIIKLSRTLDILNRREDDYSYATSRYIRVAMGEKEKENIILIRSKKIKILENKIKFYKNKLSL